MSVGVGSFSDPSELQGLSHYLEHMLFMGSDKYPDENEYDSFLTKNGGSSNAFTELVRQEHPPVSLSDVLFIHAWWIATSASGASLLLLQLLVLVSLAADQ